MEATIQFEVTGKERVYFGVKLFVSAIIYIAVFAVFYFLFTSDNQDYVSQASLIIPYLLAFGLIYIFSIGLMIGYLSGNAIKVSSKQFPEIFLIADRQSQALGLKFRPKVFILQQGGALNAFAAKFLGTNYIVIYSDLVEVALDEDINILEFVIGHELGHIKRKHALKKLLLLPSFFIPFLGSAYSRACEYTCDNIGAALSSEGAKNGILLLATGRAFKKTNPAEFINQNFTEDGFWNWFAEKISSHPNLTKRLAKFKNITVENAKTPVSNRIDIPEVLPSEANDHSKYMPRM